MGEIAEVLARIVLVDDEMAAEWIGIACRQFQPVLKEGAGERDIEELHATVVAHEVVIACLGEEAQ